jgi:DNA-binding CsgD family transcriptional regulator
MGVDHMTITYTQAPTSFDVFQTAMDLVISAESAQDLCRKLVHSDLLTGIVRGAYLYSLNNRSNLVETAGYGEPFAEGLNEISAWDENPASNSIRTKRDVFALGDAKQPRPAVVSLPLIKDSTPTGVLVLVLAPDAEESPIPSEVAPAIGKLGAYFLETRGFVAKTGAVPSGRESIEDLTTRQVTILGFMGDGLTNADISHKVLLSESTVRQETIRIYRALAVSGRQEAVAKARALGLIQKLEFTPPPPPTN